MRRRVSEVWEDVGYGLPAAPVARQARRPRVARSDARRVLAGLRQALQEALATVPAVGEVRRG